MIGFRQWLLCISVCAILVGTVRYLLPEGRTGSVVQFASGLLLLLCVLKPIGGLKFDFLPSQSEWKEEQEKQEEILQNSYDEMLHQSIAERTQAYIEDKASALGMSIKASVTVENNGALSVILDAKRDPTLERFMTQELGITRERQKWRDGS